MGDAEDGAKQEAPRSYARHGSTFASHPCPLGGGDQQRDRSPAIVEIKGVHSPQMRCACVRVRACMLCLLNDLRSLLYGKVSN